MQNKGLIRLFAIVLSVVCLYQLSFTWFAKNVENDAVIYAESKADASDATALGAMQREYLDSVANTTVVNLGFTEFTYNDVKEKEINLGLDLKGGINAVLEVSVRDILFGLSNESKNPVFNEALINASKAQKDSDKDYIDLFYEAFETASNGSVKLSDPSIFGNKSLKDKINFKMTDEEVKPILQEEVKGSINTAFEVLRSRIDRFGVTQPNIQRIGESGRILIELPGAKDIDRVRKLLQSTAELQFWEVYTNQDVGQFFIAANSTLAEILKVEEDVKEVEEVAKDSTQVKDDEIDDLLGEVKDSVDFSATNPLFSKLFVRFPQSQNDISSILATASVKDTAEINQYLAMKEVRALLPNELKYAKFAWDAKSNNDFISLYALKSNRNDQAPIQGDVISDASQVFDQLGANPEVSMTMNSKGTKQWAKMTTANVGKFVAVVLDDYVYSAPRVNDAITTGRTSISGQFSIDEAQDLANALKSGKLPAAARIIQSDVVGPSLGQEAIDSGTYSFIIALIIVLLWMLFYYGKAGIFSDIALALNILFIFGVLTSFGAVLTLPGIAGIVLTIGMSVDANVLIYERIKEELNKGKGLKESINDGFGGALSSILDANITTLLTGIILYIFGTGPVKGFATTLMIGIVTSLFSAIFITRLLIEWYVNKDNQLTFNTNITKNWFKNIDIDFLKKRKMSYMISGIILVIGIGSLFTNGLNYGVDFKGGRTYTVRFAENVSAPEIANALKGGFESSPEVKTFGSANQLKITTKYKIDDYGVAVEDEIQNLLFSGLKPFIPESITYESFKGAENDQSVGIMEFYMVGPTIADDIKTAAFWAIIGSLIVVFVYILIRFRKWQYSLGAVAAVFHDVLIVLSIFSLFYKVLPFDMEIGQSFIAAILTVVGYSLNDTVVIFDRIREFSNKHPMWKYSRTVNTALSSTLGRTVNTSLTTLIVLLAIFLFGGDSIKGFMFALIIGVIVGTYSSLFIASPIMYDTTEKLDKKEKD